VSQPREAQRAARSSREWLDDLSSSGARKDAAVADLREYLLRAVLVYLTRHRSDLAVFDYEELRQFAEDWAQGSLLQVLDNLDTFRGDSKFTTWAYRIAVNLAAGELRRKRWNTLSLDEMVESGSSEASTQGDSGQPSPETEATRAQVWEVVRNVIDHGLTERQRTALTRIVLDGAPVEIVAEELDTNRNNVYKIVHDARKKLRRELESRDWSAQDMLDAFGGNAAH